MLAFSISLAPRVCIHTAMPKGDAMLLLPQKLPLAPVIDHLNNYRDQLDLELSKGWDQLTNTKL